MSSIHRFCSSDLQTPSFLFLSLHFLLWWLCLPSQVKPTWWSFKRDMFVFSSLPIQVNESLFCPATSFSPPFILLCPLPPPFLSPLPPLSSSSLPILIPSSSPTSSSLYSFIFLPPSQAILLPLSLPFFFKDTTSFPLASSFSPPSHFFLCLDTFLPPSFHFFFSLSFHMSSPPYSVSFPIQLRTFLFSLFPVFIQLYLFILPFLFLFFTFDPFLLSISFLLLSHASFLSSHFSLIISSPPWFLFHHPPPHPTPHPSLSPSDIV